MVLTMVTRSSTSWAMSLSPVDTSTSSPASLPRLGEGADDVVGLHPAHLQHREAERAHERVNGFELSAQLHGHWRAVRLVLRVQIVAEGPALRIEDHHRELGRNLRLQPLQHVRHAVRGAGGISLRVGERGHRVKRAIQVRGAVHQDETTTRRGHGAFACKSLGAGGAGMVSISAPKPQTQTGRYLQGES